MHNKRNPQLIRITVPSILTRRPSLSSLQSTRPPIAWFGSSPGPWNLRNVIKNMQQVEGASSTLVASLATEQLVADPDIAVGIIKVRFMEPKSVLWSIFRMLTKKGRARVSTGPYIQIICSVRLIVTGRSGSTKEETKTLKNSCDLKPGSPRPTARISDQRLVAIDPGRRDMVYSYATPSMCTSSTSKFF